MIFNFSINAENLWIILEETDTYYNRIYGYDLYSSESEALYICDLLESRKENTKGKRYSTVQMEELLNQIELRKR